MERKKLFEDDREMKLRYAAKKTKEDVTDYDELSIATNISTCAVYIHL